MIVLFLGALFLAVLAVGRVARGVHAWRSPGSPAAASAGPPGRAA